MKLRHLLAAIGLAVATGVATLTPASAGVSSHCFNHSVSGAFICHFFENGYLIGVAGPGGTALLDPFFYWF